MKLLFCKACNDLFALDSDYRACHCGVSGGYYKDNGMDVIINGPAIPVGITNSSFLSAVDLQKDFGEGVPFEAFVIPKNCPTVTYFDRERDLLAGSTQELERIAKALDLERMGNVFEEDHGDEDIDETLFTDEERIWEDHGDIIDELENEKDREVSKKVKKVKNVFKDKDEK